MQTVPQTVPQHAIGYERALDLGVAALERGLTAAAVPYLEQAASFRPTRFGLVQLAKAHRDLGQPQAARRRLEQARSLPDGNDQFVLVTLAAVLCDLREHGSALKVVMEAAQLEPKNAATLSVLARCMREAAGILGEQQHIDQSAVKAVLAQADQIAQEAREAQPETVVDLKSRRQERAAQEWLVPASGHPHNTPLEQDYGAVIEDSVDSPRADAVPVPVAEIGLENGGRFHRALRRLLAAWRSS